MRGEHGVPLCPPPMFHVLTGTGPQEGHPTSQPGTSRRLARCSGGHRSCEPHRGAHPPVSGVRRRAGSAGHSGESGVVVPVALLAEPRAQHRVRRRYIFHLPFRRPVPQAHAVANVQREAPEVATAVRLDRWPPQVLAHASRGPGVRRGGHSGSGILPEEARHACEMQPKEDRECNAGVRNPATVVDRWPDLKKAVDIRENDNAFVDLAASCGPKAHRQPPTDTSLHSAREALAGHLDIQGVWDRRHPASTWRPPLYERSRTWGRTQTRHCHPGSNPDHP